MSVAKEYKLAYDRVVTALSCEMNELLTESLSFKRSWMPKTHHSGKENIKEMFPLGIMAESKVPIAGPDISFKACDLTFFFQV